MHAKRMVQGLAVTMLGGLAMAFEYIRDRTAGRGDDFIVGVDKRQVEPRAQPTADCGLSSAHHANQDERFR